MLTFWKVPQLLEKQRLVLVLSLCEQSAEVRRSFTSLQQRQFGVAEKNIINQDNGILDIHKSAVYCGNGDKDSKIPHIKFEGKIIYVLGYDNKEKWKLVLGGQYGCVYIDEVNTADIEFVRELSTRNDYLMATLNSG